MILSINEARKHALLFLGISELWQESMGVSQCDEIFKGMFSSSSVVIADIWNDLMHTEVEGAKCTVHEKTLDGFKLFLMACSFLWGYPRNSIWVKVLFFPVPDRFTRGEPFWSWVRKIQALLPTKIHFLPRFDDPDDPNCEIFIVGVDGTDCKTHERQHPTFPVDPKQMSHKFKHAGLKYEIGVAIFENKIVWVNGPFPGGRHDMTIFREHGLKDRMPEGKMAVLDRGYRTSRKDEVGMVATPQLGDDPETHKFMSRVRMRTETVMGRLKQFKCLSETWRHGEQKHEWAFKACAVIVQYQIDHGAFLYDV